MKDYPFLHQIPTVDNLMRGANHIDTKTIEGDITLRQFIAGVGSYQPRWVTGLFYIRWAFVRLLGMKQEGIPAPARLRPEAISMTPGGMVDFFEVRAAQEDCYWIARFGDKHLEGHLIIAAEPLEGDRRRFYTTTIVHYRNWAGPVYFNAIRPFHHIIVFLATRSAIQHPVQ